MTCFIEINFIQFTVTGFEQIITPFCLFYKRVKCKSKSHGMLRQILNFVLIVPVSSENKYNSGLINICFIVQ